MMAESDVIFLSTPYYEFIFDHGIYNLKLETKVRMLLRKNHRPFCSERKKSAKLPKLAIQQQIDNQEVVERMNRKITFTKNQRYLGQNLQYIEALNSDTVSTIFKIEPNHLLFTNYETYHIYEGQIKLVNKTKYIQRIKILPLKTKQFVVSSVKYPKEDSGDIASGLCVSVSIAFRPRNFIDYEDELIIITMNGLIRVKIKAQREKCKGKWPKMIECGHCWVGDEIKKEIQIENEGGQGLYRIKGSQNESDYIKGLFTVSPSHLKILKNGLNSFNVLFSPKMQGKFNETIDFISEREDEEISLTLVGGAYTAKITLEETNGEKVAKQKFLNQIYLQNCEPGRNSKAKLKIKNHAVVTVDYFWHTEEQSQMKIIESIGKIQPSEIKEFTVEILPKNRFPKSIFTSMYLYNLPKESISNSSITKQINGIFGIECCKVEVKVNCQTSPLQIFPLHKKVTNALYVGHTEKVTFIIRNNSETERRFSLQRIKQDEFCTSSCESESQQIIKAKQQVEIKMSFKINSLTKTPQKAYFLVNFDNTISEMVSIEGIVEFPTLRLLSSFVNFGLIRTNSRFRKKFKLRNEGLNDAYFRIHNPYKFYQLDFYTLYEFESDNYFFKRLEICTEEGNFEDWMKIPGQGQETLYFTIHTQEPEIIDLDIDLEIMNGPTYKINVCGKVEIINPVLSRNSICIKEMYKGNIYNSTRLLTRELSIINKGNLAFSYEIIPPETDKCRLAMKSMKGVIPQKSKKILDLTVQPIKTGDFSAEYIINYYDDIPIYSPSYENGEETIEMVDEKRENFFKTNSLTLQARIKGVQINYFLKDELRAKKVRQKVEDSVGSVKLSVYSLKSSKSSYLQTEKTIYPNLQEIDFYNCQINKVSQLQIFIENDSGLPAEYQIYAQNYHTNVKVPSKPASSRRGIKDGEEEAFTSDMGKAFIQGRILNKAQKVHLSNNKGISIMCEPDSGYIFKRQTQKVIITMFNDTSGNFRDNLVVNVKDHEIKKFPININIKGTPISLSRNQLGINFNNQIPSLNTGVHFIKNGNTKKNIKIVNNGPKEVNLKWQTYPYGNNRQKEADLVKIEFQKASSESNKIVEVKWKVIKPQKDENPGFSIEPKEKKLNGRQQANLVLTINESLEEEHFEKLLIGEAQIVDQGEKIEMESLAVVVSGQRVHPFLKIDQKHSNHINKFEKFALEGSQTNSNNHHRKIRLKNPFKSNISLKIDIQTVNEKNSYFKIVSTNSNSPLTKLQSYPFLLNKNSVQQKFTLAYETYIEIAIQLTGNPKNCDEWPMQEKIRKDGILKIMFENGQTQSIKLVGWLYRPWAIIQMPNKVKYSNNNYVIDFGTVHVKNYKKMSFYICNQSKSAVNWKIIYLKYSKMKKIVFQKELWTDVDYQDQNITDDKNCFKFCKDSGKIPCRTIPIHYIPNTLALPSQDDEYATTHKPQKMDIVFQPSLNVLYKSKFVVSCEYGESYTITVKGMGTYEQESEKK